MEPVQRSIRTIRGVFCRFSCLPKLR